MTGEDQPIDAAMTPDATFDEHASHYDAWFQANRNVLESEVRLLARLLIDPGRALSIGCGSGLFEQILRDEHGIDIGHGVEPAEGMARIAEKRGLRVKRGSAERLPFTAETFDTVLLNGVSSYIDDLDRAYKEAHRVLRSRGRIIVADVPAESSYGLLYWLGGMVGTWQHPLLADVSPAHVYPLEFVGEARWRTTFEKAELLRAVGFFDLRYSQTLTCHPKYSNDAVEDPIPGFERGDYVAIEGRKP